MLEHVEKPPRLLYRLRFRGEPDPPFITYEATREAHAEFDRLMLMAVERGKPLTKAECHAAHNLDVHIENRIKYGVVI